MIIYHGSNVVVERPVLLTPKRTLDFGAGFYTTTNKNQAVSMYEVDFDKVKQELDVLVF